MFVEVKYSGLAGAINIWAPFYDVQIDLKHPVLADNIVIFENVHKQNFFQLSRKRFFTRQENIFYELHADRTCASRESFCLDVFYNRLLKGLVDEPAMRIKRRVFGCQYRFAQIRRNLLKRRVINVFTTYQNAALPPAVFNGAINKFAVKF